MPTTIQKAVIPAAGLGTRFLPVTKAVSKVMLPVLNTPTVEFALNELIKSGLTKVAIVVSNQNTDIRRYFHGNNDVQIEYIVQESADGLGDAILQTKQWINDEPFCVLLPDDLIFSNKPTIKTMIDIYSQFNSSVIALKQVGNEMVPFLGIVESYQIDESIDQIIKCVEKPRLENAPSNQAIIGRYVFTPDIFEYIERTKKGALGEIQITDAINSQADNGSVYGYKFSGMHFDTGNPLGLLKASVYLTLQDQNESVHLKEFIRSLKD